MTNYKMSPSPVRARSTDKARRGGPYAKTSKDAKRPKMISPSNCERLLIDGITLSNLPMFHIALGGRCTDVTIRRVTVRAPASR